MDDVFVYEVYLPGNINEMVTPCNDGYTLYIDKRLSDEKKLQAYLHALGHIQNNDFEKSDVQEIEMEAHGGFYG